MKVTRSMRATGAAALALQGAVQTLAAQPAAAALPGAVARSAQSQFDSQRSKSVTASCPVGTRVTGGSGRVINITGVPGNVVLTRMEPRHTNNPDSQDGYTVTAEEDQTAPTGAWAVAAYVLCSAPLPGQHIVGARTDQASPQNRRAAVDCPAGKIALGSGARINGGHGQVHITEMTAGRTSTGISTAFATAQEDNDGFGGNWQLQVFAVCASIAPQRQVNLTGFAPGTSGVEQAHVTCPAGMTVSGGGVEIETGTPEVCFWRLSSRSSWSAASRAMSSTLSPGRWSTTPTSGSRCGSWHPASTSDAPAAGLGHREPLGPARERLTEK